MPDFSDNEEFREWSARRKKDWEENEKIHKPIKMDNEQIVAFYLLALHEICGQNFCNQDVGYPRNANESMRIKGRPCNQAGPEKIIGIWLKENIPDKELKLVIPPFKADFGQDTKGVFNLGNLTITGTSKNDAEMIFNKIYPYMPRRSIKSSIKRRLGLGR